MGRNLATRHPVGRNLARVIQWGGTWQGSSSGTELGEGHLVGRNGTWQGSSSGTELAEGHLVGRNLARVK